MTGNTKIWRAPLAGLASVAMLATMGVAAATANAANVDAQITVHGNGLKFSAVVDGKTTAVDEVTLKYSYDPSNAGAQAAALKAELDKIDNTDTVSATDPELVVPSNDTYTGLYKSAGYGVENDAFNEGVDVATDLYVHYGNTETEIVGVATNDINGYAKTAMPDKLALRNGKLDCIADWQVPTDSDVSDDNLVDYFTVQGEQADLTGDLTGKIAATSNGLTVGAKMVDSADIVKVTFNAYGTTNGHPYEFQNADGTDSSSTTRVYALKSGEAFSARYDATPTAHAKDDENTLATTWATRKETSDKKDHETDKVFSTSDAVTSALDLYVAESATTYTVTFKTDASTTYKTVSVAKGDTVAKPDDPTKAEDTANMLRYSFDKWLNGSSAYDFTKPVTGDLTLTASFAVSEMGVKFDPAHDNAESTILWFKTGDKFSVPENPTRDGYTFQGWFDGNPQGSTSASKFVGAKLRIDGDQLQRVVVATGTDSTGSNTTWTTIWNRTFTANWTKADPEDTLAEIEGNVPDSFLRNTAGGYKTGVDQSVFTEDSFDQYVSDYQDYLSAKEDAKKSGNVITNEEAAALYAQLEEAQSKLVFKATKTMQRWEKNGQHIYTDNTVEQNNLKLAGWKHEALADFDTVDITDIPQAIINGLLTEVSRLRNYASGNYMLTADANEVTYLTEQQKTWKNETMSVVYTPNNGSVAAERFYVNYNGEHLIITDPTEASALQADSANYHYDGTKFWVY